MDDLTQAIAGYATGFRSDSLAPATVSLVVDHILDALGCGLAGVEEDAAASARTFAGEAALAEGGTGASVIGLKHSVPPERAAFANGVAIRCLDYNDTYNGLRTGGHPSDMLSGILAAAEAAKLPGRAVVDGIFVAYEVFGALADQVPLREHGIDQGPILGLGVAAAIAAIQKFDARTAANAVSLTLTTTMPLRASRAGTLSMWKGAATAHAVANAVMCARIAALGMEGPPEPFRGVDGFLQRLPVDLDLSKLGQPHGGKTAMARTGFKFLPVEWGAQAPVELFLRLGREIDHEQIESMTIAGNRFLVNEIGGGRGDTGAKWDPQTRETADHSLPYLLAVALVDREVTLDSFEMKRVLDPALRPVMRKMKVELLADIDKYPPPRQPMRITMRFKDGRVREETCEYAYGHSENPATGADVEAKFRRLVPDADKTLGLVRGLAQMKDLSELTAALRAVKTATRVSR